MAGMALPQDPQILQEMQQQGQPEEPLAPIFVDPNNIALSMEEDELKKIGITVCEEYQADLGSRSDYDKRRAGWLKLFAGIKDPKNTPWPNCSNTHVPLLTTACIQFHARGYEALIPSRDIAKCYSTDDRYIDNAERASRYMNYQLNYQMEEWEEDMDSLLLMMPMMGSAYKKTYYDTVLKRVVSRTLGVDEFITPYRCRRLEDAQRKTHWIWMTLNDIRLRLASNIFIGRGDFDPQPLQREAHTPTPEQIGAIKKITGENEPAIEYTNGRPIIEQHRLLDINYDPTNKIMIPRDGIEREYVVTVDLESQKTLRIVPRFYYDPIIKTNKVMEYFTAYPFIPNPESHYGIGFGHLIDNINETANTIINQLIDAGSLSNRIAGLISKRSGMKRGNVSFGMGEFKEVDVPLDDIHKAIYEFKFKEPSDVLFALLGLLQNFTKEITTTADWMSGALPPSDTAATTMLAIIEQGLKVFSTIQKRCHRSLRRELRKIFLVNGQFLNETEYFVVQDPTSKEFQSFKSGREDFISIIDVVPVSDPNITSRAERLIKTQQVLQDVRSNPLTAQDMNAQYMATREYYSALGVQNIDSFLKKPMPQEPPDLSPEEENAGFFGEKPATVLPKQDHQWHLKIHDDLLQNDMVFGAELSPQGKKLAVQHRQETVGALYLQAKEAEKQKVQGAVMGGSPGGVNLSGQTYVQPGVR